MAQAEEAAKAHQINQMNQVLSYMGLPTTISIWSSPDSWVGSAVVAQLAPNALAAYLAFGGMDIDVPLNEHRRRHTKWATQWIGWAPQTPTVADSLAPGISTLLQVLLLQREREQELANQVYEDTNWKIYDLVTNQGFDVSDAVDLVRD